MSLRSCLLGSLLAMSVSFPAIADDTLTIYTSRKEEMIRPLLDDFTKKTGIKTQLLQDNSTDKLIARIESEGKDSPADVLMPADVITMQQAADKGLLKAIQSETLNKNIPAQLRDSEGRWYGLGKRARVIVYNKQKVKPEELSSYENLADPKWKGQLLVRSSSHPYNLALLCSMIEQYGAEKTENWAKALVANLARAPQGGDTDQIKAVAAGEASLALVNSYYYARLMNSPLPEEKEVAAKTGLFFPNQKPKTGELRGAHINISGAGVIASSDMSKEAQQFIEFLSQPEAQTFYAASNQEYPVNPAVAPSDTLKSFGTYKDEAVALGSLAKHAEEAVKIADRSGWK
jgi:iron(III) transport system substrate-binding protein